RNVKDRLAEIAPSLPQGVTIEAVYDRSDLIYRAIDTLKRTLIEESAIVALVCVVFLLHVRSALVAVITLPLGVLIAYLCMYLLGLSSNIMSLGGIAIAIGAMVDAAIVMIENAHKRLERAPPDKPRAHIIVDAASEVGPALFFSLLVITVSFLPIFALEAQEGRRFKPGARPPFQTSRVHQDLCHGRSGAPLGDARPRAHDPVRARPHHAGASQSCEPLPDLALSAGDPPGAALQGRHHSCRARRPRRQR